ncbi:MFS transporter [Streptomyces sp. Amel2xC10]|uniref:MFS transporter n=1 Tax=Streptomyces sp. Amel2xC10 TaxID=1305826 RepID=UPI000A082BCF|nr:MFS transporter [Streptomyces sp. Amel2xC10]SMF54587.1 MFS transporter, DHA1 family, multidrug resistance protein B [Streptomyces sp. Amel2xC10]
MKFSELHRNLKLRIGVGFFQRFFDIMLVPLMVIHFSRLYDAATAGLMTLLVAVATVGCNLVGGHLSDVYGRRKVLMAGEAGVFLSYIGLALVNSPWLHSGPATYVLYLCAACMAGVALPANEAMIVDVSTPESRTAVYTINYWVINVAFMLGSLVGGFFYEGYFAQLLTAAAIATGGIFLVTFLALSETAPSEAALNPRGVKPALRGYLAVARDRVFLRLVLAALLVWSVEVQISSYLAVRLGSDFPEQRLLSLGSWQVTVDGINVLGILRATNTLLVVVCGLWVGKLLGRLDERSRLVAGVVIFTAGYMAWALGDNAWLMIAAAVVVTLGELMNQPVNQTLVAALVPADSRTKYMAAYGLHVRLGYMVGSLSVILGAVVDSWVMALLYAAFGAAAIQLYRGLFRIQDARAAAEEPKAEADA